MDVALEIRQREVRRRGSHGERRLQVSGGHQRCHHGESLINGEST